MKYIYTLGSDGRLVPTSVTESLPDTSGNADNTLVTDGSDILWDKKNANKGYAFKVTTADYSNGYIVLPSTPIDVSSIRVFAVGGVLQVSEEFATVDGFTPDFAYRLILDEPRLYFLNDLGVVSGLSEAPNNLFSVGMKYIVYYETKL